MHVLEVQQLLRYIHCPPKVGIPVSTKFVCYTWNIQRLHVLWSKIRQTWGGGGAAAMLNSVQKRPCRKGKVAFEQKHIYVFCSRISL